MREVNYILNGLSRLLLFNWPVTLYFNINFKFRRNNNRATEDGALHASKHNCAIEAGRRRRRPLHHLLPQLHQSAKVRWLLQLGPPQLPAHRDQTTRFSGICNCSKYSEIINWRVSFYYKLKCVVRIIRPVCAKVFKIMSKTLKGEFFFS